MQVANYPDYDGTREQNKYNICVAFALRCGVAIYSHIFVNECNHDGICCDLIFFSLFGKINAVNQNWGIRNSQASDEVAFSVYSFEMYYIKKLTLLSSSSFSFSDQIPKTKLEFKLD